MQSYIYIPLSPGKSSKLRETETTWLRVRDLYLGDSNYFHTYVSTISNSFVFDDNLLWRKLLWYGFFLFWPTRSAPLNNIHKCFTSNRNILGKLYWINVQHFSFKNKCSTFMWNLFLITLSPFLPNHNSYYGHFNPIH